MVTSPWKSVWCCWMSNCDKFLRMCLMLVSHKLIRQSCMRCRLGETLLKKPVKSPQVWSFCRYSMWVEHIYMPLMISYMIQFYPSNVEQFTNPQLPKSLNVTWFFSDELSDKDWAKDFGSGTILVKPESASVQPQCPLRHLIKCIGSCLNLHRNDPTSWATNHGGAGTFLVYKNYYSCYKFLALPDVMMYDNTASNVTNMYRKGKYKCVGQKVDLCWTKIVPPKSALLQITFAHVVKQVVCCISPYKFTLHGSLKIECSRLRTFVVCSFTAVEIIASISLIKNWVFLTTQSKTYPCPSQSWGKPKYFELHTAVKNPHTHSNVAILKTGFEKACTPKCVFLAL